MKYNKRIQASRCAILTKQNDERKAHLFANVNFIVMTYTSSTLSFQH